MAITMKEKFDSIKMSKLPENYKAEFEAIKKDSKDFNPKFVPIFQENFDMLYGLVEKKHPEALQKGGVIKKARPTKVKKVKAKATHGIRPAGKSEMSFLIDQLSNAMEHESQESFADHISEQTDWSKNTAREIYKGYYALDPKEREKTSVQWAGWLKKYIIDEEPVKKSDEKTMVHKSRGKFKSKFKKGDKVIYIPNSKEAKILEIYPKPHTVGNIHCEIVFDNNATIKTTFDKIEAISEKKDKAEPKGDGIEECRKVLTEAGYTTKKKISKDGKKAMKVSAPRPERAVIHDKVSDVFKTINKDISGSEEKDKEYKKMQWAMAEMQNLMSKLLQLVNNLAEDNSMDKVEKIITLLKKIVPKN